MKFILSLTCAWLLAGPQGSFAQSTSNRKSSGIQGLVTTEQRSVGSFGKLTVQNAINVFITPGDAGQIELTSEADQLAEVITKVNGNELLIEVPKGKLLYNTSTNRKGETTRNSKPISVTLHVSGLTAIRLKTACSLTMDMPIEGDQLTISLDVASNLTAPLSVKTLDLTLGTASRAALTGSVTGKASLVLTEASRLQAEEMRIDQAIIELSGSSRADVQVTGTLRATADGVSRD